MWGRSRYVPQSVEVGAPRTSAGAVIRPAIAGEQRVSAHCTTGASTRLMVFQLISVAISMFQCVEARAVFSAGATPICISNLRYEWPYARATASTAYVGGESERARRRK